ncbi:MAG: NAD-dependent epimerase/dehydratase family protein [Chitinispirillia bacterium]|nr:NAD-dependent epimerase/dehydratase family protein [Chitinispirillia bacterium]MCL2241907.1 NAD-dependent epimerase/dehydratase family protein [Chitinispirillia bacterium]
MANILVTGADGFIGQHLVRRLVDGGHAVRTLSRGDSELYFFSYGEVDRRTADIGKREQLSAVMDGIDTVYHLAAIARNDLRKTWDNYNAVNIQGTANLLEEAKAAGVKKFVFISTVEAAGFGDGKRPRTETDPPNPINNYGKSKLLAEQQVLSGEWPMKCTVLRLPMIYGPGTFLIVPKLFGVVRRGVYPLIGSGKTKMEFCFVDNAVGGIILAGEKDESSGELFYISDERSYSIKEVVSNIAKSMDKKVLFIRIPVFAANLLGLCWEIAAKILPFPPVISKYSRKPFFSRETVFWTTKDVNIVSTGKIREKLGYSPAVNIENGTRKTAEWLNEKLFAAKDKR